MAFRIRRLDRRAFLQRAASLTGAALVPGLPGALGQAPAIVTSDRLRPSSAFGVMTRPLAVRRAAVTDDWNTRSDSAG